MIPRSFRFKNQSKIQLLLLFVAGALCAGIFLFASQSSLAQRNMTRRVSNGGGKRETTTRKSERTREQDNKGGQGKRSKPVVQRGPQVGVPSTGAPGIE